MEVNMDHVFMDKLKSSFLKRKTTTESGKSRNIGSIAENIACEYLQKHHLTLVEKNYLCKQGEIDLIMQDQHDLVFIEVRYRKSLVFGTPIETISKQKIARIRTAIQHYTMKNNLGYIPCRVDMIGLHGKLMQPNIHWIKNIIID